jgi:hypothetical protein
MEKTMERRLLQLVVVLAGFVPVLAGGAGVLLGAAMVNDAGANLSADSHFRYLSGLLLAIGLAFWWMVPRIERHTASVRLLTVLVFVGGLGRLLGLVMHGIPGPPMLGGLVMELVVTPAICLWQGRVGRT